MADSVFFEAVVPLDDGQDRTSEKLPNEPKNKTLENLQILNTADGSETNPCNEENEFAANDVEARTAVGLKALPDTDGVNSQPTKYPAEFVRNTTAMSERDMVTMSCQETIARPDVQMVSNRGDVEAVLAKDGILESVEDTETGSAMDSTTASEGDVGANTTLESDKHVTARSEWGGTAVSGRNTVDESTDTTAVSGRNTVDESVDTTAVSGRNTLDESTDTTAVSGQNTVDESIDTTAVSGRNTAGEPVDTTPVSGRNTVDESTDTTAVSGRNMVHEAIDTIAASGRNAVDESTDTTAVSGRNTVGGFIDTTAVSGRNVGDTTDVSAKDETSSSNSNAGDLSDRDILVLSDEEMAGLSDRNVGPVSDTAVVTVTDTDEVPEAETDTVIQSDETAVLALSNSDVALAGISEADRIAVADTDMANMSNIDIISWVDNNLPDMNFSHLCDSVLNEDMGEIRWLFSQGLVVDSIRDSRRRTVLHYAAERGLRTMITGLVDLGASVNAVDIVGKTPLHCAVGALATHFIHKKLIIIEPEFEELQTSNGEKWVSEIVQKEKIETAECLQCLGADLNATFDRDVSSLQRAVYLQVTPAIDVLLQLGVNVNNVRFAGLTALSIAIDRSELLVMNRLLELGADANATYCQMTILHDAVRLGRAELVDVLVKYGANVNARKYERVTPVLHALLSKVTDDEVFESLAKSGANFDATLGSGTAIHSAIASNDLDTLNTLIQNGADVAAPEMRMTALGLALSRNDTNLIKSLVDCGADVNHKFDLCIPPLILAERQSDLEIVKTLLVHGADINDCRLLQGVNALYQAVDKQKSTVVDILLELGAKVDMKFNHGMTALHEAVSRDDIKMVRLLTDFKLGSDLNATRIEEYNVLQLNVDKFSPGDGECIARALFGAADDPDEACQCLEGLTSLHDAILGLSNAAMLDSVDDLPLKKEIIETLIQAGANLNSTFSRGVTALHTAVRLQNHKAVEVLCELGMKVDNMKFSGVSPLSLALDRKQMAILEYLVGLGADVNCSYSQVNALHDAIALRRNDITETLLKYKANVDAKMYSNVSLALHALLMKIDDRDLFESLAKIGVDMNTTLGSCAAVHQAVAMQDLKLMEILMKYGADLAVPRMEITALSLAIARDRPGILGDLVRCGADVNLRFDLCVPLLLDAIKRGHSEIVEYIVGNGADINDCRLLQGVTVLYQAVDKMKSEMVKTLLCLGADVNATYDHKVTALHGAVARGDSNMAAVLVNLGADLNAQRGEKYNVLHLLLEKISAKEEMKWASLRLIRSLTKGGVDVNMGCSTGVSALHDAVRKSSRRTLQTLLKAGADVSLGRVEDFRPIHMATGHGRVDVAKYIYCLGADLNASCSMNISPLDDAVGLGSLEAVKLLAEFGGKCTFTRTANVTALYIAVESGDIEMIRYLAEKGADVNCKHLIRSYTLQSTSAKEGINSELTRVEVGTLVDVAKSEEVMNCLHTLGIDRSRDESNVPNFSNRVSQDFSNEMTEEGFVMVSNDEFTSGFMSNDGDEKVEMSSDGGGPTRRRRLGCGNADWGCAVL